jgi:hypothetical protein
MTNIGMAMQSIHDDNVSWHHAPWRIENMKNGVILKWFKESPRMLGIINQTAKYPNPRKEQKFGVAPMMT